MDSNEADGALSMTSGDARTISILKTVSTYLGLLVAAIGALVLIGWAYDIAILKSVSATFVTMKANTAACFVLIGLALALAPPDGSANIWYKLRQYVSGILSVLVAAIGLVVLSEYLFGWDLGIDQLIFKEPAGAFGTVYPGRLALTTALSFVLAGLAMFDVIVKAAIKRTISHYLSLIGLLISLTAIIGYLYGLREFLGPTNLTPLALYTAIAFLLLFCGIPMARAGSGPMSAFLGNRAGSAMLRITLPSLILIIVFFGWLRLMAQRNVPIPPELRAGIFTVIDIAVIAFATIAIGIVLNRLDRRRWEAEEKLRHMNIQLEQDLSKTELFLRTVLQHAPTLTSIVTPDGHYLMVNKAWEEFYHISSDRAVGHNYEDLFSEKIATERREADEQILDNPRPLMLERKLDTPKGHRYLAVVKFPLLDSRGEVEAIANISTDLTERKLAEIRLQDSENLYHSTLDNMLEGAQIIGRDWRYIYLNDSAVKQARKSREELIGHTMMESYPGVENTVYFAAMRQAMEQGISTTVESEFTYPDGSTGWFELSIQQVPDGILVASIDRTERKKAEDELKNNEVYYRSLIESSTDLVNVLDVDGTVRYASPSSLELMGYPPEEVLGRNLAEFVHPDDMAGTSDAISKLSSNAAGLIVEARLRHKDGHWITFSSRGRLLPDIRPGMRVVINSHDISARLQAQKDLSESYNKLQGSLSRTIDLLVAITEKRDPYTAGHQKRVTDLACAIAREMGLADSRVSAISMAGTIHDLGKINVPADLLNKPGKLSNMEFAVVKIHPDTAFDIIKVVDFPAPIADIVHQHHERMDGSGYPLGLHGEEILLESRILAVADVVEAMASHRPYRPALGLDKALEEIKGNKGGLYDEDVVNTCLRVFDRGFRFQEN
ncbi:MAG: PAS domain-containing protein [Dehalococcoidia bacterium]|jgi:PAS domain S-box-containing protein